MSGIQSFSRFIGGEHSGELIAEVYPQRSSETGEPIPTAHVLRVGDTDLDFPGYEVRELATISHDDAEVFYCLVAIDLTDADAQRRLDDLAL